MDNNRNVDTDQREKAAEKPDQPDSRPRTKARAASPLLGLEPASQKKGDERQAKLHRGADWRGRNCSWPEEYEEAV